MDIRKPSLLWLRKSDIRRVSARLLHLCLEPGQFIEVATCDPWVPKMQVYASGFVSFQWQEIGKDCPVIAWLKLDGTPRWDLEWETHGMKFCDRRSFNDKSCRPAADLIKAYAKHFPFVPSDNYFLHDGKAIA